MRSGGHRDASAWFPGQQVFVPVNGAAAMNDLNVGGHRSASSATFPAQRDPAGDDHRPSFRGSQTTRHAATLPFRRPGGIERRMIGNDTRYLQHDRGGIGRPPSGDTPFNVGSKNWRY